MNVIGKRLRISIDQRYLLLKDSGQLKINGQGINDITDLLAAAIRPDMSLETAAELLRGAGFRVFPVGAHVLHPTGAYAQIDDYAPVPLGGVTVTAVIELSGATSSTPSVKSIHGAIVLQFP